MRSDLPGNSSLPAFFRQGIIPVARKVLFPILVLMPASFARLRIIRYASDFTHGAALGGSLDKSPPSSLRMTCAKP